MATVEGLIEAFRRADAILALEGYTPSSDLKRLQQAVIEGRMTFGEAIASIVIDAEVKPPDAK